MKWMVVLYCPASSTVVVPDDIPVSTTVCTVSKPASPPRLLLCTRLQIVKTTRQDKLREASGTTLASQQRRKIISMLAAKYGKESVGLGEADNTRISIRPGVFNQAPGSPGQHQCLSAWDATSVVLLGYSCTDS